MKHKTRGARVFDINDRKNRGKLKNNRRLSNDCRTPLAFPAITSIIGLTVRTKVGQIFREWERKGGNGGKKNKNKNRLAMINLYYIDVNFVCCFFTPVAAARARVWFGSLVPSITGCRCGATHADVVKHLTSAH